MYNSKRCFLLDLSKSVCFLVTIFLKCDYKGKYEYSYESTKLILWLIENQARANRMWHFVSSCEGYGADTVIYMTVFLCVCRYHYCERCFEEIPGDAVNLGDDPTLSQR